MKRRTAIVTGGMGGLGTAICQHLARQGCQVIAADLPHCNRRFEAFRIQAQGMADSIDFFPLDVSNAVACQQFAEEMSNRYGHIDILANVAGITRDATLRKMQHSQWDELMRVNLDGVFNMTRAVIETMVEHGFGRVINISSVNGQTGQFGQTNYSAAKAGVHGFSMALAREVATKGITVNTVSPGYCKTAMVMAVAEEIREKIISQIPIGRLGSPDDVARVVAFLAADEAGYLTGINLPVNGGYFMSF